MKPALGLAASYAHRFHPRYQGCIAHWILLENGGTTLYDVAGYKKDLTISGNPVWTNNSNGSALDLDGTGDYGSRAIDSHFNLTQGSILCRVRRDTAPAEVAFFSFGDGSLNGDNFLQLTWKDTTNVIQCGLSTAGVNTWRFFTANSFGSGVFFDLALTVGPLGILFYIDAALQAPTFDAGSSASTGFISTPFASLTTVDIGRLNCINFPDYFDGAVEYVKIYNRVLSPYEVYSHDIDPYLEFELNLTLGPIEEVVIAALAVQRRQRGMGA